MLVRRFSGQLLLYGTVKRNRSVSSSVAFCDMTVFIFINMREYQTKHDTYRSIFTRRH